MLTKGTCFTWSFTGDATRKDLSIYQNLRGKFCLQRGITHNPRHFTIETLSSHDTLEDAVAVSESL
jgi:hypothetical protein